MKKEYIIYIAVAAIVIIGIAAYLLLNSSSACTLCGKQVSGPYLQRLYQIANNNTLADGVGAGIVTTGGAYANLPKMINGAPLYVADKPEVLYVGGDFCPYCAVTRWGLIIALMRFGNFTNLTYMESSSTDVFPNTPTFSFTNYSYNSNLVHFDGFEIYSRQEQNLTPAGYTPFYQFLIGKYSSGGIPFIDFANSSVQSGAVLSPQILHGYNWNQVLSNLTSQDTPISQAVIGNANLFTAYICKSNETLNSTAMACQQGYIKSIIG